MFHSGSIHDVAGCEESDFGFAHLGLNLLKGVLAPVLASLKSHYHEYRWQDAG